MTIQYVDPNGGTFIIPAAYPSVTVAPVNSGLATTGVLMLVGEAEAGAAFSEEADLASNAFSPDQAADVVAKYKGGNLVEAFKAAAAAVVDPDIGGSFTRAILVKTNSSTKAQGVLKDWANADWSVLADRSYGALGNLIAYSVSASKIELGPAATFTYIPVPGYGLTPFIDGVNSGSTTFVDATPATFVTTFNAAYDKVIASGGDARAAFAAGNVTIAVPNVAAPTIITFTHTVGLPTGTAAGDTLIIPAADLLFNIANRGFYVVKSVLGAVITAEKVANTDGSDPTNPVAEGPITLGANPPTVYEPVTFTWDATLTPVTGRSHSVEFAISAGTEALANKAFKQTGTSITVTWLSVSGAPKQINSSREYVASINLSRQYDGIQESIVAGGEIGLQIGCTPGTAQATATISATKISLYDGTATTELLFSLYPTINDLIAKINTITGTGTAWVARATSTIGNLSPSTLDTGVYNCSTKWGAYGARIKNDAYRIKQAMTGSSVLGQLGVTGSTPPTAGLPAPTVQAGEDPLDPLALIKVSFLSGGAKGSTSQANFNAAIDALEKVRGNFVAVCFSRDASEDSADGLTDPASSYTIEAINAYTKSHVHKMSTVKARRNRQAFLSKRDTFANVKEAAGNLASPRCSLTFEDFKSVSGTGIYQFQPWMAAVNAAALQAAAFYKSILRKAVNTTGVLQAAGDWTYNSDGDLEEALLAGLLPIKKDDQGAGHYWVSDQTTYGKDSNSVYNSIQMVYSADTVALSTAYRMERAFVGKSIADVSANVALAYLEGIMADMFRLRLIASSDDAPRGYKNAVIKIEGPVMKVSLEIKLAGAIYFIPISFYVTEIKQSATQG